MKVNLLSLYGVWVPDFLTVKDFMTFPRADRDLLILPASFNLSPWACVSFVLSDPAKSIMWNVEDFTEQTPFWNVLDWMKVERTEWDLELFSFILVAPTCLFFVPNWMRSTTSS
jgi:hypothetical protein